MSAISADSYISSRSCQGSPILTYYPPVICSDFPVQLFNDSFEDPCVPRTRVHGRRRGYRVNAAPPPLDELAKQNLAARSEISKNIFTQKRFMV